MRHIVLFTAALLPSCVAAPQPYYSASPPPAAYNSPPQPLVPPRAGAVHPGTVTNFAGSGDGSKITVKLTTMSNGNVRAEGGVSGVGGGFCAGSFSGTGSFRGQSLVVRDETVPECNFTLTRSGRRLTVDMKGRVPRRGVGAVGKSPAVATAESLA